MIAISGLGSLVRRRAFLFLVVLAWVPFLVRAVQIWASVNVDGLEQVDLLAVTPRLFRDFLSQQGPLVFFLTVYCGSGLIADDIRANALQLYLSRPLTRSHYIAGKAAIVMTVLIFVTWVPAACLLLLVPAFSGGTDFLRDHPTLLASISAVSLVQVTLAAVTMLALSSLTRSRWVAAIAYAGVAFLTQAVFGVTRAAVGGTGFSWISLSGSVEQVGDLLFGLAPRYDTSPALSACVLALVIAGSLAVLSRRIRAVEVVA